MEPRIESALLGVLTLVISEKYPDYPCYTGKPPFGQYGDIDVSLICLEGTAGDLIHLLSAAELKYPKLVAQEAKLLLSAQSEILELHRKYFENKWKGTAGELMHTLKLENCSIFDDETIELWYAGGHAFRQLYVHLNLDSEMRLSEVGFDG